MGKSLGTISKTFATNHGIYGKYYLTKRQPGLPIRDCVKSCVSAVPRCAKVSTIDVTAKTFFARVCFKLVLGFY